MTRFLSLSKDKNHLPMFHHEFPIQGLTPPSRLQDLLTNVSITFSTMNDMFLDPEH